MDTESNYSHITLQNATFNDIRENSILIGGTEMSLEKFE